MYKYRLEIRERRKRRITILVIIFTFLLLMALITVSLYVGQKPWIDARSNSIKIAKDKAGLKSTNKFYYSNLDQTYYTVQGKNKQGKNKYVVIKQPHNKFKVLDQDKGITAKKANKIVMQNYPTKKIINTSLSFWKGRPVWVVSSFNKKNNLDYVTMDYKNGKVLQSISNI